MVKTIPLFCILTFVVLLTYADGNVASLPCGGKIFVEDSVVIDIPSLHGDECVWDIQTQDDRILAFTLINERFEDVQDYLTVHDGVGKDSPSLQIGNQMKYEASNKDLPPAMYTTSSVATLRSRGTRASVLQLKIQKAALCPFNLGPNTACGRIVDEISCYCMNFALLNWDYQMIFCYQNGMKLVSLESYDEEQAILSAWDVVQWSSLSDVKQEGNWVWETTGAPLIPGYQNWNIGEPNSASGEEDCMAFPSASQRGWYDDSCNDAHSGTCVLHP
ncbi:hypothetical protein OUZ56_019366 [Daphnia magna]|uniref:C-type lectin domain-containing protein n=1 Tax=Daphnia magna TaxID=35525 RepID=A0ABQ9ZBD1_9CRUS|nr:hypothetical protein OUZ56_019366 [Daphnia magna]